MWSLLSSRDLQISVISLVDKKGLKRRVNGRELDSVTTADTQDDVTRKRWETVEIFMSVGLVNETTWLGRFGLKKSLIYSTYVT